MDHSEHPGVTQRPPAYAHLLIDSKDRNKDADRLPYIPTTTPANDFLINRGQALLYGYFTRLSITQIEFEYRLPTVIAGKNDTFVLDISGGATKQVTIPAGYYADMQLLAAAIEDAIQGTPPASPWNTFTVLSANGEFVIESNSTDQFSFRPFDQIVAYAAGNNSLASNISRCYKLLGVVPGNTGIGNAATGQTTATAKTLYTGYVDICSRNMTKFQRVKDIDTAGSNTKSFIIARLYFTPPGQRVLYEDADCPGLKPFDICVDYNTPKHIRWSPNEAINQLDIQVLDEYGELLYWDIDLAPWEFQLTCVASES